MEHQNNYYLSDPLEMQFIQMVVQMIGAKKTLDIGRGSYK